MISLVTRGLLLSLGLVLATAFAARPAQAGFSFWDGPNCNWPTDVPGSFGGTFFGNDKCEAVCKLAAGACKAAVKEATSCTKGEYGAYYKAYVLYNCASLTGVEKASCLAGVKADKLGFKSELADGTASALDDCRAFMDSCIMGCSTPPLVVTQFEDSVPSRPGRRTSGARGGVFLVECHHALHPRGAARPRVVPRLRARGPGRGPARARQAVQDGRPGPRRDLVREQLLLAGREEACEKLCKKGRATCAKHVNRAVTCARKSIDDSTFFQEQVSCDGQHGSALKACRKGFEDTKKDDRDELEGERDAALDVCNTDAQDCAENCGDAPPP